MADDDVPNLTLTILREMRADVQELRTEMHEMREDVQDLRTEVRDGFSHLYRLYDGLGEDVRTLRYQGDLSAARLGPPG